jgi:hypothetical protein
MSTKSSGRSRARATPAVANVDPVTEDPSELYYKPEVTIERDGGSILATVDCDWPAPVSSWGGLLADTAWIVAGIIAERHPESRALVMERLRKAFDSAC